MLRPYFIGISGGTASGKTTLCKEVFENLSVIDDCVLLSMDNFYKGLSVEQHNDVENYNFDHPDALDFDAMYEVVKKLLNYEDAEIPNYDFSTHKRTEVVTHIDKSYFILFEGILSLHDERIRDLMDLKLFVHEADDIRLWRRIKRDIAERGRDVIGVLKQWHTTVKPSFDEFVRPTMKHADLIVKGNQTNKTAINFIVDNLTIKMVNMGIAKKQIEVEEALTKSSIAHHVNEKMDKEMFELVIKKLIDEKKFEEMHLVYLTKKLKELYNPPSNVKITLVKNLNKKTSLNSGNLVKTKSTPIQDEITRNKALAVFCPSLLSSDEISSALDKINFIDESIGHLDVLALFGDQKFLQEEIDHQKIREDLIIDVFTIGSMPLLENYEINEELANKIFISEFKG